MDIEKKIQGMNRVLMIAYHFPPIQGSSGVHRTVQFAKHLPSFGWAPVIVAPHSRAYPSIGDDAWAKFPEEVIVKRAFALDSARHLAIKGRYLGVTAIPDRWVSWVPAAVIECLWLIRKYRPQVIWSTYPVASAHLIGLLVSRFSGMPWIADFRDPMVQEGQPASRANRKLYQYLEKEIVRQATRCVFVSRSAMDDFQQRYQNKTSDSWQLIENGYDESLFEPYGDLIDNPKDKVVGDPIRILHSGLLYLEGRNPLPFLKAVKSLIVNHQLNLEIVFRGSGNDGEIGRQIQSLGLEGIVKLLPSISYDEAIKEMVEADVLTVFQGAVFNRQIPAKIYEYIRAGRPILALIDETGETARMLHGWDGVCFANIESEKSIEKSLLILIEDLKINKSVFRNLESVSSLSRYSGAKKLNNLLTGVTVDP